MEKRLVGLDIETVDPLLKTQGYSWKYNQGYVLNTALYYEAEDKVAVVAGLNNKNCPYSEEERKLGNQDIKNLLTNPDVCIVGANLQYDLGWLLYEYGMSTYDVKCSLIDVLQAEAMLDEFNIHSLEEVSWKYLKYGKQKDKVEEWVLNNVPRAKGDFRKYLEQVPYDLLCEYVEGDAKNPVKVWRVQFEELKKQELVERAQLEFDCLLPTLQMTMTGIPFDDDLRRQMLSELIEMRDIFKARFEEKVGKTGFNVNSSAQIASVCDRFHIPYSNKITLKSYNGKDFKTRNEKKAVLNSVKRIVSSFRIQKGFIIAYVPHEMAERTELLLSDEGYTFNSSPNLDKHFMAARRDEYEIIADIADWKQANSIISKILGESYARFVCPDGKMRPQFRITDTISFRFSSVTPNCLAKGTKVLTVEGYKNIENLALSDFVITHTGKIARIKAIWNKGVQIPICLTTDTDNCIICTKDHKFFTPKGWVKAKELKEIYECKQITVKESSDSKGSLECNKSGQDKNSISDCCGIKDYLSYCSSYLANLCKQRRGTEAPQRPCFRGKKKNKWNERKKSTTIQRSLLRQEESSYDSKEGKWKDNKSIRAQTDDGRFDWHRCEKSTSSFTRASYQWNWGRQSDGKLMPVYSASSCTITQNVARITKIEELAPVEVYDIEVDNEDHSFIANGFLTHNCQQIPSKNMLKVGEHEFPFASLRRMFHAEKGCVFGKIDYGQIEYRLICNIACGEAGEKVRAEYAKNPKMDFHQYVVDLTGLSRKYAKNMSFGVSFGMGLKSMAEAFGWSIEKAEEISEKYHEHMPFVRPTLALVGDVAERRGYIKTVCKSHARLPDKDLKYTMLNRYTQGSGAECMKSAIVKAYHEGIWKRLRVANDVHDEINSPYVEPTEQGVLDLFRMAEIMRTAVPLRVPLEATPEVGTDWYNVREVAEWIELRDKDDKAWHETSSEVRDFVNIAARLLEENRIKL